ncbi:hypothetical protein GCM10011490_03000 [Pseudoclavibacter endophyticus]|uniref:Uncharacterized protein n=1 Tax=Pseudoclavibacter endophyticus TaxID=1778590 RepID=A0A6H9WVG2_9MICO|nr:hypothetical protein [Pseudoclavibacter endophyticus]KAB1650170.1 hypothetical protein F8O04_08210 [Pseudoclavibacter endophyticus]GGA56554.1 hypothetical protein GCM10011490_03000 [Pseudoclavibacter endophyticus]
MPYEALIAAAEPLIPRMVERVIERRGGEPLMAQQTDGGGAMSICRPDGEPVVSIYAPFRVDVIDDLVRVYPSAADAIDLPAFVHEVLIGNRDRGLGEELATAIARTIGARLLPLDGSPDTDVRPPAGPGAAEPLHDTPGTTLERGRAPC